MVGNILFLIDLFVIGIFMAVIDIRGENLGRSDVEIIVFFVGAWYLGILRFECFFIGGFVGVGAGVGRFGVLGVIAYLASRSIFGMSIFCLVCSSYFSLPYFWSFNCLTSSR